jgi:zona occludens toxin
MAITLYTGDPRAGKSYGTMLHVLLQALKQGRIIVTNLAIKRGALLDYCIAQGWPEPNISTCCLSDIEARPSMLAEYEKGCVFIFDEIWNLFKAGSTIKSVPKEYLEFLRMHGHRVGASGHTDQIILLTQHPDDLPLWVKNIIKETYWMTKLDSLGQDSRYRVDVWSSCPGARGKKPVIIRQLFGKYKSEVYDLYHSQSQKKDQNWGHGDEAPLDDRKNIFKSPFIRYGFPASLLLVCLGTYFAYLSITSFNKQSTEKVNLNKRNENHLQSAVVQIPDDMIIRNSSHTLPPSTQTELPHTEPASRPPQDPSLSTDWRLAAVIESTDSGEGRAYALGRTGLREIPFSGCSISDGLHEWTCSVDGKLVAAWTGEGMSAYGNTAIETPNF